jgi:formamidase
MKIETQDYAIGQTAAVDYLVVNEFSGGIVGPSQRMLGPLKHGGTFKTGTPPGYWGPMITPAFCVRSLPWRLICSDIL